MDNMDIWASPLVPGMDPVVWQSILLAIFQHIWDARDGITFRMNVIKLAMLFLEYAMTWLLGTDDLLRHPWFPDYANGAFFFVHVFRMCSVISLNLSCTQNLFADYQYISRQEISPLSFLSKKTSRHCY